MSQRGKEEQPREEIIKIIEEWKLNFHLGSVLIHIDKANRNKDAEENIKNAIWYLNRYLNDVLKVKS